MAVPFAEPSQAVPDAPVLDAEEMSLIRASAMASKHEVLSRLVFGFPDAE